jgi:hypothetical protein
MRVMIDNESKGAIEHKRLLRGLTNAFLLVIVFFWIPLGVIVWVLK